MNKNNRNLFQHNAKYLTISCYVIGVIFISIIAFRMINNWESTRNLIGSIASVIGPYFIGFLIAYLVNPLVNYMHNNIFQKRFKIKRRKLSGLLAILVSYFIVLGFILVSLAYIVPQLITSITELITQIPGFYNEIIAFLNNYVAKNPHINANTIDSLTNDYLPHLQEFVLEQLQTVVPALYGISISIVKFLINFLISIIVSIYMISDKNKIINYLKIVCYAIFSESNANSFFIILKDCNNICKSFFIGKTIDSLIIGCLCFFLTSILNLPYAVLISVIVGITNMIPYFGPYIGAIPGILILLIDRPTNGFIFGIIIILLQSFDGMILGPKILGTSTGLRPLVILFAISCGGAIAGPLGMFLGVPAFAIIAYLIDKFVKHQLKIKHINLESLSSDTPVETKPDKPEPSPDKTTK